MSQKKCPHCGEFVQKNSLTCPKCFGTIPREHTESSEYVIKEDRKERSKKASSAVVLLSLIPPFFGLLGLGMIYRDHKDSKGYWFLAAGLVIFLPMLALLYMITHSGFFSAVLLFIALAVLSLIYLSAAAAAFLEAVFGSALKILRF